MALDFQLEQPPGEASESAAMRALGASFASSADPADTITICGLTLYGSRTGTVMVGDSGRATMANASDLRRIAAFLLGAAEILEIKGGDRQQAPTDIHASFLRQQGFAAVGRGHVGSSPTMQERDA